MRCQSSTPSQHVVYLRYCGLDFVRFPSMAETSFHMGKIRVNTQKGQTEMPIFNGWTTVYVDNHDGGRPMAHYGSVDPKYRVGAAKLLCIYVTSPSGILSLPAGREIGMVIYRSK